MPEGIVQFKIREHNWQVCCFWLKSLILARSLQPKARFLGLKAVPYSSSELLWCRSDWSKYKKQRKKYCYSGSLFCFRRKFLLVVLLFTPKQVFSDLYKFNIDCIQYIQYFIETAVQRFRGGLQKKYQSEWLIICLGSSQPYSIYSIICSTSSHWINMYIYYTSHKNTAWVFQFWDDT